MLEVDGGLFADVLPFRLVRNAHLLQRGVVHDLDERVGHVNGGRRVERQIRHALVVARDQLGDLEAALHRVDGRAHDSGQLSGFERRLVRVDVGERAQAREQGRAPPFRKGLAHKGVGQPLGRAAGRQQDQAIAKALAVHLRQAVGQRAQKRHAGRHVVDCGRHQDA